MTKQHYSDVCVYQLNVFEHKRSISSVE